MQKRPLGRTGIDVGIVGFGAIKLHGIDEQDASSCLNAALDGGVNYIDTARNYRDSEEKIGKAVGHRRDEYFVATKSSARDGKTLTEQLDTSLRNLRTDRIDIFQLHTVSTREAWEQVRAPGGAYEAAVKAREQGKVLHVGVTIHRELQVMREAIASGLFETIMLCYNPLDSENVGAEILPMARAAGMGTIIMKPLSGGQLCAPLEHRRAGLGGPDAIVAGALRFVLQNPNVDCAIPGMQQVREVEENIALAESFAPLSAEEHDELVRLIGQFAGDYRYGQQCLRCGYCQPCPQGVEVPEVLRAGDMLRGYADELKHLALEAWEAIKIGPDACVECENCLDKCPAGINIPDQLKSVRELFGAYREA